MNYMIHTEEEWKAIHSHNLQLMRALQNAKGWIVANTTKPVHDLIANIDSALGEAAGLRSVASEQKQRGSQREESQ